MNANQAEALLDWSKPKEITTKYGPRILRKANPTEEFWQVVACP